MGSGWGERKGPTGQGDLGAGVLHTEPSDARQLAGYRAAYDRLFHRCRAEAPALTEGLPSPHELRTGETPEDIRSRMERLRSGEHLQEHEVTDAL